MGYITINGGKKLSGKITISGAKNSAVALIPAAILSDEIVTIKGIPNISDIDALNEILNYLNVKTEINNNTMIIDPRNMINREIPENISSKLRASYYFMASLLGKCNSVNMYFPGGCNIGKRPIDQTLKVFRTLGAIVEEDNNKYSIHSTELVGNVIDLDMPSVGATINALLSSVKANGTTVVNNTALEPEIDNVIEFLNKMGAKIERKDNSIIITGVPYLNGTEIDVIPDRIEAGTYLILGALIGDNLEVDNINTKHISSLLEIFNKMNINYTYDNNRIIISKSEKLLPVDVTTKGYPGFPTDLQQPLTVLLTNCDGISHLTETIYENRFQNVEYLNKMGAKIDIDNRTITIYGKTNLVGNLVKATDLRAGACMVIAALIANGSTTITDIEHVLRGYDSIIEKLTNVGAKIEKVEI